MDSLATDPPMQGVVRKSGKESEDGQDPVGDDT
jgi:hypothetical protein